MRSFRFSPALGLLSLTLTLAGCLIDRGALTGPPPTGIDAGPLDAFVEPTADAPAPTEEPDAFVAPEIDDAFSPPSPDAGLCDEVGEACCGTACRGGLDCVSDICEPTGCGMEGRDCCSSSRCFSTTVCDASRCVHCGRLEEPCCNDRSCESGTCNEGRCAACGELEQPCCEGSCRAGTCSGGRCRPPEGSRGGPCRGTLDPCDRWSQCNLSGICEPCGLSGETCCGLGDCMGSARCNFAGGFRCG